MTFEIFAAAIVLTYMLGALIALRVFDRNTELSGEERAVERARAGLFWPGRFIHLVTALVTGRAAVLSHGGTAVQTDPQI